MNYEVVTLQEKTLTGVWVRTDNEEPEMMKKIGGLWQRFFGGDLEKIPNRKGEAVYGLYTNYQKDNTNVYDAVVCCETDGVQEVSGAFKSVVVPAGKYAKFTFHGDAEKDTGAFWMEVWNTPLARSFTCDFEEYPPCADCHNAEIVIYVALADLCQSCGMPMTEAEHYGTNADGSKNEEYCCYCYKDGAFTADCTMEQMIDFCLNIGMESGMYTDREAAKKEMMLYFPTLSRWKNA